MTKDRLTALRAAQDNRGDDNVDDENDEPQSGGSASSSFMAEFRAQVNEARSNLSTLEGYIDDVKRLHAAISGGTITHNNDNKMKSELEERMAEIKKTTQALRHQ